MAPTTWTEAEMLKAIEVASYEKLARMLWSLDAAGAFVRHKFLQSVARDSKKFGHVTERQAERGVRRGLREFAGVLAEMANRNKATGAKPPDPYLEKRKLSMPWGGIFYKEPGECRVCRKGVPQGVNYCSSKCANDAVVQEEVENAKRSQVATRQDQELLQPEQKLDREARQLRQSGADVHDSVEAEGRRGSDRHVDVRQSERTEAVVAQSPQHPDNLKQDALKGDPYSKTWDEIFWEEKCRICGVPRSRCSC